MNGSSGILRHAILAAALVTPCIAAAASYPERPVRIVVPVSAGGGVDSLARIVAQHYNAVWGQPFIVDNRPGAGGSIGAEIAARAAPDGYTLMVSSSSYITNAAIREVRYDPIRDFQPITKLTTNPYIIVVTPSLPVKSVNDLVALARAKPDTITYASSGTGGILHMGAELLTALTNTKMTHVPYKGVADGYPAVMSGTVNWMLGSPISAQPQMKAGRLRGIAVTGEKRIKALPDLPAIAESVPGYEVSAWFGLFAPAHLPAPILEALYKEAAKAVNEPQLAARMEAGGTETVGNPPREFTQQTKNEYDKWRNLVKKAGLKLQ
ncbi:MAG: tripartite tricarboxylate transporter substrate binding protein [Betaproteobacteria bacterium]|jgi:tripartite-type tricarboxylate transporter receptor subunit TctC|nr:tripartite tricarboxylate transporter substrate binding protein [Betaproteobacteria bacterium]MDH5343091.1 tripartite tricarboxylate transporter substrate binding protein [Betaproteobacteria bacterium]